MKYLVQTLIHKFYYSFQYSVEKSDFYVVYFLSYKESKSVMVEPSRVGPVRAVFVHETYILLYFMNVITWINFISYCCDWGLSRRSSSRVIYGVFEQRIKSLIFIVDKKWIEEKVFIFWCTIHFEIKITARPSTARSDHDAIWIFITHKLKKLKIWFYKILFVLLVKLM